MPRKKTNQFVADNPLEAVSAVVNGSTGSAKEGTVKGSTVKGSTVKGGSAKGGSAKEDTVKGGTAKEDTVKGGSAKGGTVKGGTVKGGTLQGGTAKGPSANDTLTASPQFAHLPHQHSPLATVPEEWRLRTPLLKPSWMPMLHRLLEHPHAPRFNHRAGDRLGPIDLESLQVFRKTLECLESLPSSPPDWLSDWVWQKRAQVPSFVERVPASGSLEAQWENIPTCSRRDVAFQLHRMVPLDAPLSELIVYRTAGTTGHALLVPHHARAAASYQPLLERALKQYGVCLEGGPERVACMLLGAQARTVTYPCVLSYWGGAGFAKLNLREDNWSTPASPRHYLSDLAPQLLTGDPITYSELLRMDLELHPRALVSTAVAMSRGLKQRLELVYGCPVIDWYSLTETGPLGYVCRLGNGYHQVANDVYLEALDAEGRCVKEGERGEITVTGGRNPFLPLLRYRTGDWGRLEFDPCLCGDPMPRILDLEGRAPILFRGEGGVIINPVDVSRVLREFPLVQHTLTQRDAHTLELVVRLVPGGEVVREDALVEAFRVLFGRNMNIQLTIDPALGDRESHDKLSPYRSHLLLED